MVAKKRQQKARGDKWRQQEPRGGNERPEEA